MSASDLPLTRACIQAPTSSDPLEDSSQMIKGMRGFVKHTLSLGFSSQRLQLQQQMALDEQGEALPSVKLMQENARLIVLTQEVYLFRSRHMAVGMV